MASTEDYNFIQGLGQQSVGSWRGCKQDCESRFHFGCQPRYANGTIYTAGNSSDFYNPCKTPSGECAGEEGVKYKWPDGTSCYYGAENTQWAGKRPCHGYVRINYNGPSLDPKTVMYCDEWTNQSDLQPGGPIFGLLRERWSTNGNGRVRYWFACQAPAPVWTFHGGHRYAVVSSSSTAAGAGAAGAAAGGRTTRTTWNEAESYCTVTIFRHAPFITFALRPDLVG